MTTCLSVYLSVQAYIRVCALHLGLLLETVNSQMRRALRFSCFVSSLFWGPVSYSTRGHADLPHKPANEQQGSRAWRSKDQTRAARHYAASYWFYLPIHTQTHLNARIYVTICRAPMDDTCYISHRLLQGARRT